MRLAKQIRKNKLIYSFVSFLVDFYSIFFSFLENLFFRNNIYDKDFHEKGIFKISSKINFSKVLDKYKKFKDSDYHSTIVFSEEKIKEILYLIFDEYTRRKITKLTGFKYSIDYIQCFESSHYEENNYGRSPHFDKSFSRNMLKLFIPLNVDLKNGPLKVWNKSLFSKIRNQKNHESYNPILIVGSGDNIFGFNPNNCFHQVGNPDLGTKSIQIMIQMNPSLQWCIKDDLHNFQLSGEQKFTSLSFLFNKTTKFI